MRIVNNIGIFFLCVGISLAAAASEPQPSTDTPPAAQKDNLNRLKATVAEYQNNHCNTAWEPVAQTFKSYLSTAPGINDLKNSGLPDLGLVCIQQPSLKLWYFPKVSEDHGIYLQWPETSIRAPHSKTSSHKAVAAAAAHVQYLPLPLGVVLKDARLLVFTHTGNNTRSTAVIKRKSGQRHRTTVHRLSAPSATVNKFLVLAGFQQQGKTLWLDCYQLSGGAWHQNTLPLSKVPPFLLGSLSGDIAFVGNDLLLTASPSETAAADNNGSAAAKKPNFSVYKLSLRLVDNYYLLDGQEKTDTAHGTVTQFLQAEQTGRIDLAKAWLEDPSIASIPKYLKLFNQGALSSFRLISLSAPRSIYRYRLITFGKNDLIFDIGRPKEQWIIKAIFVAPSDAGWQRIAQSLPPMM